MQTPLLCVPQENLSWYSVINIFHKVTSATSADYILLRYELLESLRMTGSNRGKRIKLGFIDLNSRIDE